MEIRKATILVAIVMLVVAAPGCKTVAKSDYIVISLKDFNNPELGCQPYPTELLVRPKTKWIVIANNIPRDPADPMKNSLRITVPAKLTTSSETIVKEVESGEIMTFKLNRDLEPRVFHGGITAVAPTGHCKSGLPNPQIVIP